MYKLDKQKTVPKPKPLGASLKDDTTDNKPTEKQ
jgi:hypothetical protein